MDFTLTSKVEEDGVRGFINDMENGIIHNGKAGLEEIIEYHIAEFEIIGGYYYDQGRNITINHVIEGLYNLRLKLKSPAHIVIKLLMSSMYGKTIIKPVETDTTVKDNKDDFEQHIYYIYNYIDSVIGVNGVYYTTRSSILSHYDYVHCCVEILSMSKRIMNKVFSCADDCGVKIYYQDTGSIHLLLRE